MAFENRKIALITGASGGIGYALAKLMARDGHELVLVARTTDTLHKVADECRTLGSPRADVLTADLTDPKAPQAIFDFTTQNNRPIDWLVNNAGFGAKGLFHELDTQLTLDMLQVNITALTHLTRLYLPGMVARKSGKIMNLGSTAGYVAGPHLATYYASKAYVLAFSEAISIELKGTGVTVTDVCPGPTHTSFQKRANMVDSMFKSAMSPDAVAKEGYKAFLKGKPVFITGFTNRFLLRLNKFAPRYFAACMTGKVNCGT